MRGVIYLPVHRRVPSWAIDRLQAAIVEAVKHPYGTSRL